jgi:hypothetical protein
VATTEIENLYCPECGVTVRQSIRHQGFRAGGTSIGPSTIPCPACGTVVKTGDSEWDEKGLFQKSWFFLSCIAWWIAGSLFVGGAFACVVGWCAVESRLIAKSQEALCIAIAFVGGILFLGTILMRNALWEIRESRKRSKAAAAPVILILATAFSTGCNSQPANPARVRAIMSAKAVSESAAFRKEPKVLEFLPIADTSPITEETLQELEQNYACKLPEDYRRFLLSNNGAFPSPDCVVFEENNQNTASDVFCFFALDDNRAWCSMDWHLKTFSDRLPKETLPIGRDSCGNLWLLSLRNEDAGSIFFWDHGSFDTFDETDLNKWPKVAMKFQDFHDNLGAYESSYESGRVPSRYSLVKRATEDVVKRDPQFSTRANPDYVWHCDCDSDAKFKMQFVQYEIHAAVTHTCGYARLCAIKGLIKEGQTRLPE